MRITLVLALLLTACDAVRLPPAPPPTPPAYLQDIPVHAPIQCHALAYAPITYNLFEYAERPPRDGRRAIGDRGAATGAAHSCEVVDVLAYEWSDFGQEYWVMVVTPAGQHGWLAADLIAWTN